jgi:AraC family transcriptional regulator
VCAVIGGGFLHKRSAREYDAGVGVLIPIAPGEPHSDSFGPAGALCINLFFDQTYALPGKPWRASPTLRNLLAELSVELALGACRDALALESLSAEIVALIDKGDIESSSTANTARIVIEAIEDAPERRWTLAELAALAGRSPSSLARAFRRRTGMTIGAWRRRRRLARLCLDLRLSAAPLAEIAQRHGFSDQAHMTRCFRASTGATPAAFRALAVREGR